ncbi:MAG: HAD-IA family hydrolase [Myxococcota bacterium]
MGGPTPSSLIFDFDFTLADSSAGIIECVTHALAELGFRAPDPERIRETIGLSRDASLEHLVGGLDAGRAARFFRAFVERADKVMVQQTFIYGFVPALVAELRRRGHRLGIVSTKFRYRIESILAREGLADSFDAIVGGEDTALHKPDPAGLLLALERLRGAASDALYVGDHPVDGQAARAAALPFVATLSGVTPREAFAALAPIAIVSDASEVPAVLERLGS